MAFNVSYIYEILDRYSAPLRNITNRTKQFNNTVKKTNFSLAAMGKGLRSVGRDIHSFGQGLTTSLTLVGGGLTTFALIASANMETMKTQFEVMLGSAEKSKQMIAELTQYSKETPFELPGVTKAARVMLSYGFEQKRVMEDMKMLGDVSAGSGKNLAELAVIYGQVKNAGRLMGQEALQFVQAGVPLNKELAKIISEKLNISFEKAQSRIKKLGEQGKISFEMVRQAMYNMRSEGGSFAKMTERLAMTLAGKWAKFSENFSLFAIDVGDILVKHFKLKDVLDDLNAKLEVLGEQFKTWTDANPVLTKFILIMGAALLVLGPLLVVVGLAAQGFGMIATAAAAVSWPIVAMIGGVIALTAAFNHWFKSGHPIVGLLKQLWEATGKLMGALWNVGVGLGTLVRKIFGIKQETSTLGGVFDRLGYMLMPIIDTFTLFVTGLGNGIDFIVKLFEGDLIGAFDSLKAAGDSLKKNFRGLYDAVTPVFHFIWDLMADIKEITDDVVDKLSEVIDKIKQVSIFRGFDFMFGEEPAPTASTDTGRENAQATATKNNLNTVVNAQGLIKVVSDDKTNIVDSMIKLNDGENIATSYP